MDAVYIFRHSAASDLELRYSLRSLARHAPWIGKVWIFGDRPAWITADTVRIEHLSHDSIAWLPGYKTPLRNTFLMMVCAAIHPRLPAEFLWMCDDYIILRDFSPAAATRVRYIENLDDQSSSRGDGIYRDALWRTYDLLVSHGLPRLNYETHVPMPLSKERILAAAHRFHPLLSEDRFAGPLAQLAIFNHACARERFVPLLLASENSYVGFHYRPSVYADILRESANKTFLNFDDIAFGPDMRRYLVERFPDPSPYESADAPPITEPPTFESPATDAGSVLSPSSSALLIAFPEKLSPEAGQAIANLAEAGWRIVSLGSSNDPSSRVRNRLLPAGLRTHCDELVWIDGRYPLAANDLQTDHLRRVVPLVEEGSLPTGDAPLPPCRLSRRLIIQRVQQRRLPTHQLGQHDEWIPFFPEP